MLKPNIHFFGNFFSAERFDKSVADFEAELRREHVDKFWAGRVQAAAHRHRPFGLVAIPVLVGTKEGQDQGLEKNRARAARQKPFEMNETEFLEKKIKSCI